jgi:ATP-binding cassette subfamily A (ABC1) protein 3
MWDIISKLSLMKKKSAVIITTHSMEEAEALCTKMGIMVAGEFKCFGTSTYIKDRYGEDCDERCILGIKNKCGNLGQDNVTGESSLLEYIYGFINQLMRTMSSEDKQTKITYQIEYEAESLSFSFLNSTMTSLDVRKELLEDGIKVGSAFLELHKETGSSENEENIMDKHA